MTYLLLFVEFFKTGLFSIGGGLATLPFLYELADKYTWFTRANLSDMIAVSESTPGPIGVNMATYAGYTAGYSVGGIWGGILGAVVATCALVLPSIIIIVIIAKFLQKFSKNKYVQNAFYGLRPAVCALIAGAGFTILEQSVFHVNTFLKTMDWMDLFDIKAIVLFAVVMIFSNLKRFRRLHPVFILAGCAIVGIVLAF